MDDETWPFVPVATDLKDLLKPVGGHWSLIWDKTHHWGDSLFLVHCQPLTNRKAVQSTLNCSPIGQCLAVDQKEGMLCPEDLPIFNLLNILVLRQ